jgi:hypothetical protein
MKIFLILINFAILIGVFSAVGAYAADQPLSAQLAIENSKKAEIAASIITMGEEKMDAILLIGGVKMLDQIPVGVARPGQTGRDALAYNRDELLDQAKKFAGKNKNLLEVIADLKAEKTKDYIIGNCYYYTACNAYGYCWTIGYNCW